MFAQAELAEYLDEIRQNVCSRCVERPEGGPPCLPLGKMCGVEMHTADLVESIHQVRSNRIEPYLNHNHHEICEKCTLLHSGICPCPMDYLGILVVQAVETVDERLAISRGAVRTKGGVEPTIDRVNERRCRSCRPASPAIDMEELRRAYQEASGTWKGCDWPTVYGKTRLNLQGWTSAQARAMARAHQAEDWFRASDWLAQIEHQAQLAEKNAGEAMQAAGEGRWRDALIGAERAWSLEFSTGRPLRHGPPLAWQRLREMFDAAYLAHEIAEVSSEEVPE